MKKSVKKDTLKKRKTSPRIILTALIAIGFIVLAFWEWVFIIPALFLWWLNNKYIKKHFGV